MSEREPANRKEMGDRKYRERIHRDSKYADSNKNLPYSFSKPKKDKPCRVPFTCVHCGRESAHTEETIAVICGGCNHLTVVRTVEKKDA